MKKVVILGSTGSIGTQTLEVIRRSFGEFSVLAISCGKNIDLFRKQLAEFKPKYAACQLESDAIALQRGFPGISFGFGIKGLCDIAAISEADVIVNGLMGMMGLRPTFAAVNAGKTIAFANKETLVAGGKFLTDAVSNQGAKLLPVDSEHSAIFQCLQGAAGNPIKRLLLTASGGPFRGYTAQQLKNVTKEQALKHPNWSMGAKITVDSATMLNKGLEIIEASLLFGVDPADIQVLVHPESVLHSAVEFEDGAVIGQMGAPDMKIPIAYALSYPKRMPGVGETLDLFKFSALHFEQPDLKVFKCLALAKQAISAGQSQQIVLNASNEEAVAAFLADKISFVQIADVIQESLEKFSGRAVCSLDDIFEIETEARTLAKGIICRL